MIGPVKHEHRQPIEMEIGQGCLERLPYGRGDVRFSRFRREILQGRELGQYPQVAHAMCPHELADALLAETIGARRIDLANAACVGSLQQVERGFVR